MHSDRNAGFLQDIGRNIELATAFVNNMTVEEFEQDILRVYAVTRSLEIISEASRRLSDELKARHPHIAWREMAGAGNVYRHGYGGVAAKRIWETVRIALPPLHKAVQEELSRII